MVATTTPILAGTVILDLLRSLGYEPTEVCEVVATPFELTVTGYQRVDGRVQQGADYEPLTWSKTHRIDWSL